MDPGAPGFRLVFRKPRRAADLALGQLSNRDGPINHVAEELQQVLDLHHSEKLELRYGSVFSEETAQTGKDLFADSIG